MRQESEDSYGNGTAHHPQRAGEISQEVMLIQLVAAFVLIEHGKLKLLDLLKVIIHLELYSKHGVQVV